MTGKFYGVGVGPGDPELLTIKAMQIIKGADVIIAPKTEKKEDSVALRIATPYLKEDVEVVKLVFPMVSDTEILTEAWEENKTVILSLLAAGKKVVFLTLGDPMFYSTYIYVFRLLENCGYPIETIPGVTAFCAIGSKLGYPVVEGDDVLCVVPATISPEKLDRVLETADNVVMMKVYHNAAEVIGKLDRHGLAEHGVMISRCGLDGEKVVRNLKEVGDQRFNYLSTILSRRNRA